MRNKLTDLNDHLFAQLERLSDEDLSDEQLEKEIERSKAVTDISKSIISNASLRLDAMKLKADHMGLNKDDFPKLLTGGDK